MCPTRSIVALRTRVELMEWRIVAKQKNVGGLAGHNYIALMSANGEIVREFHGLWRERFTVFSTSRGNHLIGRETPSADIWPPRRTK